MRRAFKLLGWFAAVLVVCACAAFVLLPRIDPGPFVAGRATAALGRAVEIGGLRLVPGRDISITLSDVRVANIPGGSAPDMLRLGQLSAEVALLPLLRGAMVVREARAEGFHLLLERNAERRRNWRFGATRPAASEPQHPRGLPLIQALSLAHGEIVVRTSSGRALTTRIDTAHLAGADPHLPAELRAEGSYNGAAITARLRLGPVAGLHAGQPVPLRLHAVSGETTLEFDGTARDPLNADGLDGRVMLHAPTPDPLLRMAQLDLPVQLEARIEGAARRDGNLWQVKTVEGSLFDAPFTGRLLELTEGAAGEPDSIVADLDFSRIDLNRILVPRSARGGSGEADADLPLVVPAEPDPRLRLALGAREFGYAALAASDVRLAASQLPGRIAIEELLITVFGARFHATGGLEPAGQGARIAAEASLLDGELGLLQRAFATRPLPVSGPVQGRLSIAAEAAMLNQAFDQAKVAMVLAMTGGTIAREVIEMASTDIRALFRTARGNTPLSCLLAVIDMKARRGEASPVRIRAGTGTIVGQGSFDLNRRTLDLVIGTQRDTTDFFALDVPVRVHGPFADPDIALADWSPASRSRLGAGDDVASLPPALAEFARANPCYQAPRRR